MPVRYLPADGHCCVRPRQERRIAINCAYHVARGQAAIGPPLQPRAPKNICYERAFYDAVAENESAVTGMGPNVLADPG